MAARLTKNNNKTQEEVEMPLIDIINNISGVNYIYINDISYNGKKYEIKYEDNLVSFAREDGREITCYFNLECSFFRINFYHPNGDCFILKTDNISCDSDGNIIICLNEENTEIKFSSMFPSFSATITDIDCYDIEGDILTFDSDSISYTDYEVSLDGRKLLRGDTFSNIDFEKVKEYKPDVEESNDDNDYSRSISNLVFFSRYEMPIVRKLIEFRAHLINNVFFV